MRFVSILLAAIVGLIAAIVCVPGEVQGQGRKSGYGVGPQTRVQQCPPGSFR